MSPGQRLLALALPALALCSACPSEVGAKCNDDSNCPTGQFCASGFCAVGAGGSPDAGNQAGLDAGPQAPLAGTVTLNGGFAEPSTNTAWVFAWDHKPAIYDAGIEEPQLIAQTVDGGGFAFGDAGVGTSYYLGVVYDLDGDGVFNQPGDRLDLIPNPQTAGAAGSASLALDAQTSSCLAWSLFQAGTTSIYALIADIPEVSGTGSQLPSSSVKAATATDPNSSSYGLTQIMGTGISSLDGKYGYVPSVGTAPTAPSGIYRFAIQATGYPQGTCQVNHQPLSEAPIITVPNPWVSASTNQVSWTSVPGTESSGIEVDIVETDGSEGPQRYENPNATSPFLVPAGACPPKSQCRVIVIVSHTEAQEFRGVSVAAAEASDIVQGT